MAVFTTLAAHDSSCRFRMLSRGACSIALSERSVFAPSSALASSALASAIFIATSQFVGCGMMFHATLRHGSTFMNS